MKTKIILSILLCASTCWAQFRNSGGNSFPYSNTLNASDVFVFGVPGSTNKNIASSNLLAAARDAAGGVIGGTNFQGPANFGFSNLFNVSSIYGRSFKTDLPWTTLAIMSNQPLRVLILGDSVAAYDEYSKGVRYALDAWRTRGGYGSTFFGANVTYGSDGNNLAGQSTSIPIVSDGHSARYHCDLTNGQVFITSPFQWANSVNIQFTNAFGSMLVETNTRGGTYGAIGTIVSSAAAAGYQWTNWTLPTQDWYGVKITSTHSNTLLTLGLYSKTNPVVVWDNYSYGGIDLTNIMSSSFYNYYTNYDPQLVLIEFSDYEAATLSALDLIRDTLTNKSDKVLITKGPSLDVDVEPMNKIILAYARTNNDWSVFDSYSLFLPTNYWRTVTPTDAVGHTGMWDDAAHLGKLGIVRKSQGLADFLSLDKMFNAAGRYVVTRGTTNVAYFSVDNAKLIVSGAIASTLPVLPNELFFSGPTVGLNSHGYVMVSGAPRGIHLILPPSFVEGKRNFTFTQRWLCTNAQIVTHQSLMHRLSWNNLLRQQVAIGNTGAGDTFALTGTNIYASYRSPLAQFDSPLLEGEYITCALGHSGTLTNTIWWLGVKVEAW